MVKGTRSVLKDEIAVNLRKIFDLLEEIEELLEVLEETGDTDNDDD